MMTTMKKADIQKRKPKTWSTPSATLDARSGM